MLKLHTSLNCLISLNVSEEESVRRLLNRGITSGRSDDNEAVIRNRRREYDEKTRPVLQFIATAASASTSTDRRASRMSRAHHRDHPRRTEQEPLQRRAVRVSRVGPRLTGPALAKAYDLEYVATGPMLDQEIKDGTETGRRITALYESGQLGADGIRRPVDREEVFAASNGVKGFDLQGLSAHAGAVGT